MLFRSTPAGEGEAVENCVGCVPSLKYSFKEGAVSSFDRSPVDGSIVYITIPSGTEKSENSAVFDADFIKFSHIGDAALAPVSSEPRDIPLSNPTHTDAVIPVVYPTNHASL